MQAYEHSKKSVKQQISDNLSAIETLKIGLDDMFNDDEGKGLRKRILCELTGKQHHFRRTGEKFKPNMSAQPVESYRAPMRGIMFVHFMTSCECGKKRLACERVG